jgi:glutamate racemase
MDRPIGVFDSGIGGLTVVKEIIRTMPSDSVVYFGDTARVPYGTKSPQTVTRFALESMHFLLRHDVKLMVVACNSASSVALEEISRRCPLPVLGVINPGAVAAAAATRTGKVGVIGTNATVESGAYQRELRSLRGDIEVKAVACPLFVPFAEEGLTDHKATRLVAQEYLEPVIEFGADVLVLGCTHYPLLRPVIQKVMGKSVKLIDSASETARLVKAVLESEGLVGDGEGIQTLKVYLSDVPRKFESIGTRFLGRPIDSVECIDQTDLPWYER